MKLFKQLLVAPAALGLLAPVAATAAELNLDGVNKYAAEEQVTSISQFSDVKPTDWAYQALSNLIERYGCVAGYPDGTYKGGRAMTRFEAAALLNACLDRVTEVTDELKKLMAEFEKELAILKGRVDGLEAKVGELEANQFSTTTKLKGIATFTIGGASNGVVNPIANQTVAAAATGLPVVTPAAVQAERVAFNYDVKLMLDTSFTGKDLLRTTLRSGNAGGSVFGGGGSALLESYFQQEGNGNDTVTIDRLFYQFPIGENFTGTFGAKVSQGDMLAMWPSVYPADSILDRFTTAGANGAYNLNLGAGAGIWYEKEGFSVSVSYVSNEYAAPYSYQTEITGGGLGDGSTTTVQVGYAGNNWGAAFAYNYTEAASLVGNFSFLPTQLDVYNTAGVNNYALSAYWQPEESGWIPSISAGVGAQQFNGDSNVSDDAWSWMVGLQWADAIIKGNAFGIGLGEANTEFNQFAFEVWYKFQVTDNISVTPAIFWIENGGADVFAGTTEDSFGAVLKTTFKF
ncbi:iron uptake porin [Cyanobium sp. FACHB-13342]|uniref:iron uptake porin n=1 Tax=Cyanobium sp. FACHB-13342 TaxID=2692793 RepID=UPI00168195FD|nr:iron uptake porin [Cyanobium sp. FACHB-13342]MBD2423624.1 carbohydrate porin [Cyanobium sp. FACHB-13342]